MTDARAIATGILVADANRLILRPAHVLFRRRTLLRILIVGVIAALLIGWAAASLFRPHTTYVQIFIGVAVLAAICGYQFTTQVTFVWVRSSPGLVVETKNRLLRTTRRKFLHLYADISAVGVRSRINPNVGAAIHYDVLLEKNGRWVVAWYTKYPECAVQIAATIAQFAGVEFLDQEAA